MNQGLHWAASSMQSANDLKKLPLCMCPDEFIPSCCYGAAHMHSHRSCAAGSMQSSLRKLARRGLSSLPHVFQSEARGQILPASANTTLRLILHPWELRKFYFRSDVTLPVKAVHLARYTAVEAACLFARIVASGLGTRPQMQHSMKLLACCYNSTRDSV